METELENRLGPSEGSADIPPATPHEADAGAYCSAEVSIAAEGAPEEGGADGASSYAEDCIAETAESQAIEKGAYFGSVKFFKNVILAVVLIAITVPTVLSVLLWRSQERNTAALETQAAALAELQTQYDALTLENQEKEAVWGASVAGSALNGAEAVAYQELYPDFYVTESLGKTPDDQGVVYLTFDDGPSSNTPLLLSILDKQDVKATFFVVGGDSERQRQWMRDIVDAGHTLGMHSYTHNYHKIYESVESFLDDYYKLYTNIKEATGAAPTIFRFPGGSINSYNYPVYREIIAEMLRRGFVFYDWNISSGDASSSYISPERITSNVLSEARFYNRGIVLFHDAAVKDSTVEALTGVIDGLRDLGFTFAPLSREVRPIIFNYEDYQKD